MNTISIFKIVLIGSLIIIAFAGNTGFNIKIVSNQWQRNPRSKTKPIVSVLYKKMRFKASQNDE